MRRSRGKWFKYAIAAILILWPLLQIGELLGGRAPQERAEKLLYQVSLFQMERLNSYLLESAKIGDTAELDALRQAVYSAQFTHEHLTQAYREGEVSQLPSLQTLMQYLLRLQAGGSRPLKAEEQETLADAGRLYNGIYTAYSDLVSGSGSVSGSRNGELVEADEELDRLLKKKLP
ncbi:S-adenosylmethionine decarboxylase [Paenibacillus sp. S-38]|uniref:S-adenosylmethionine decarboxylase n=1 Tax=Paenibacillus sp. S-38 TaxID=3416710 RepID=UPI003CE81BC9